MTGSLKELLPLEGRVAGRYRRELRNRQGHGLRSRAGLAAYQVVIVARDPTRLSATCRSLRDAGCAAAWVSADLSDRAEVRRGASAAAAAFGEPDILVNCAGVNLRPPLGSLSEEHWDLMLAVNLTAPFLLGQRFGPAMAARGWGRIINVTSQQAMRAFGNSGGYGASKAGLAALTRSQSEAWSASGVCVNSVCPGFVSTPLTVEVASDPVRSAALADRTHMGRNGEPSDFAGVAVFLASAASDYITGQTIYADGGFSGA